MPSKSLPRPTLQNTVRHHTLSQGQSWNVLPLPGYFCDVINVVCYGFDVRFTGLSHEEGRKVDLR